MIPILIAAIVGANIGFVIGVFFGATARANLQADLDEALLALDAIEAKTIERCAQVADDSVFSIGMYGGPRIRDRILALGKAK
jgi:hypothetical protein